MVTIHLGQVMWEQLFEAEMAVFVQKDQRICLDWLNPEEKQVLCLVVVKWASQKKN